MAGVPTNYRNTGEAVIASYNYTDIAEGTGITTFYGYSDKNANVVHYGLTGQLPYSYTKETSAAVTVGGVALDLDFDAPAFNLPKAIKGTALVSVPHSLANNGGSADWYSYVTAYIRKWDGTTETEIASASGAILDPPAAGQAVENALIKIPITSYTHFKKGEKLRLTITTTCAQTGAGNTSSCIGHDPKGRAGSVITLTGGLGDTTILSADIPFVIDL